MGEHTDDPTDQIIREIVNDGYYESAEYISEEETVAMAHEILELRRCKARLKEELREHKNCACRVEYDYRCPVHGED